jgi:hypothetical protein
MDRGQQTRNIFGGEAQAGGPGRAPDLAAELLQQFQALERRVLALETRLDGHASALSQGSRRPEPRPQPRPSGAATAFPVFGEAFLALAGAYLLRALTEYHLLPLLPGVAAGILYALLWLLLARRATPAKHLAAAVRGVTSGLILVPLLWEATVNLGALSAWGAAAVILLYASLGLGASWSGETAAMAWTSALAGVSASAALVFATRDLVPFCLVLLALAAGMEMAACCRRRLPGRWLAAVAADLALLFLASIAASPGEYVPIGAGTAVSLQIALPLIYLASTSVRALAQRDTLTALEIGQLGVVLLLGITGVLRVTHRAAAVELVAASSLLCGAFFYGISLACARAGSRRRNFYAYSSLGLLLVWFSLLMSLSGAALAAALALLALLGLIAGIRPGQEAFRWHGAACVLLGNVMSGLAGWAAGNVLGAAAGWTAPPGAAAITAAATFLGYLLIGKKREAWARFSAETVPALALAAAASWALAGLSAAALTGICGSPPAAPLCTALRTFVLTGLAVLLARGGMAWKRRELVWLVYFFMALVTYKLLAQDLLRGQTLSLFASLFFYGGALILLPRILQRSGAWS